MIRKSSDMLQNKCLSYTGKHSLSLCVICCQEKFTFCSLVVFSKIIYTLCYFSKQNVVSLFCIPDPIYNVKFCDLSFHAAFSWNVLCLPSCAEKLRTSVQGRSTLSAGGPFQRNSLGSAVHWINGDDRGEATGARAVPPPAQRSGSALT